MPNLPAVITLPLHTMRLLARWCAERATPGKIPVAVPISGHRGGCLIFLDSEAAR